MVATAPDPGGSGRFSVTSAAETSTTDRLGKYMKELNREDARVEKELAEHYAEALELLGMSGENSDFSQNIVNILMASKSNQPNIAGVIPNTPGGESKTSMTFHDEHHSSSSGRISFIDEGIVENLIKTIAETSDSAEVLCSKVRQMDVMSARIQKTLELVSELLQVRECAETVHGAIQRRDFEAAAKSVAKYKQAVLNKQADQPDSIATLLDESSISKLEDARKKLSAIVNQEFENAIKNKDQQSVARFAKLFYPLGLAESAVVTYIQFIRERIRETAQASIQKLRRMNFSKAVASKDQAMPAYADALWSIFAHISDILQHNKENLETEFGVENYVQFLKGIYAEVSVQQTKILNLFKEQEYLKFLPSTSGGGSAGGGTSAASQPTTKLMPGGIRMPTMMSTSASSLSGGVGGGSSSSSSSAIKTQKDKIRTILVQMQYLLQKSETFDCFIRRLIADAHSSFLSSEKDIEAITHSIVGEAEATKAAQDLVAHYVLLQKELLLTEIQTAVESDEIDTEDTDPGPSSLVDDVFFVLKTSIESSMETCNLVAVCCLINEVGATLSKEGPVYQSIEKSVREALPPYRAFVSDLKHLTDGNENDEEHALAKFYEHLLQQGGEGKKTVTSSDSWPHAANNAYKCQEYLERLIESARHDFTSKTDEQGELLFPEDLEPEKKVMFDHCLQNLQLVKGDFQALCVHIPIAAGPAIVTNRGQERRSIPGIPRNTVNALKHHLIPSLQPFEENSFNISEQEFQDWQVNDLFVQGFILNISTLHLHLTKCYLPEVVDAILDQLIDQTCNRLATNVARKDRISLYGGLQFDQDVRALMNYFLSIKAPNVRKKFKRLTQISSLLSLENARELKDFFSQQKWELKNSEIRLFLCLRFPEAEVDRDTQFLRA
ncbi:unnamed protein product [Amoebophrya sp. A120]|nr:unnamed protein product [Amoebophrya sp. A120]|eukprot:GSA120T00001407001.1